MGLLGAAKVLAHIIGAYVFLWWGRRLPLFGMYTIHAVACMVLLAALLLGMSMHIGYIMLPSLVIYSILLMVRENRQELHSNSDRFARRHGCGQRCL